MKPEFITIKQGEDEWKALRSGILTASKAHYLMPNKRTGKPKDSRIDYMNSLIAEICTGLSEEIYGKPLEWGKTNEIAARAAYEFESQESIQDGGFIFNHNRRVGASPDGLIIGKTKGLELKCPFATETHIEFLLHDTIKDEYLSQCQWSMWVAGYSQWAFASFDPRMKSHMLKIALQERDEKLMKYFDEEVPQFIHEMDSALAKLGIEFRPQSIQASA